MQGSDQNTLSKKKKKKKTFLLQPIRGGGQGSTQSPLPSPFHPTSLPLSLTSLPLQPHFPPPDKFFPPPDTILFLFMNLKCMFFFNILLYSQINISLWTNFIFTDHLSIWLVNYRSFYSRVSNLLGAAILQLLAHINLS